MFCLAVAMVTAAHNCTHFRFGALMGKTNFLDATGLLKRNTVIGCISDVLLAGTAGCMWASVHSEVSPEVYGRKDSFGSPT